MYYARIANDDTGQRIARRLLALRDLLDGKGQYC